MLALFVSQIDVPLSQSSQSVCNTSAAAISGYEFPKCVLVVRTFMVRSKLVPALVFKAIPMSKSAVKAVSNG